jgi:hypothetical protein
MNNTLKIDSYTVELKTALSWFDIETVKMATVSGTKISGTTVTGIDGNAVLEAKMKLWQIAVVKITDADGKVLPFSLDWVKKLSQGAGATLDNAIADLDKKK